MDEMDPPVCRVCGAKEWRHTCSGTRVRARPLPKPVTKRDAVVTRRDAAVTAPCAECERLRAENADLKRQLASVASTGRVASTPECPVCKARRATKAKAQKRWRATSTGSSK